MKPIKIRFEQLVDLAVAIDRDDRLYKRYLAEPYCHGNVVSRYLDEERIVGLFQRILG
jgi:hypothetical protein